MVTIFVTCKPYKCTYIYKFVYKYMYVEFISLQKIYTHIKINESLGRRCLKMAMGITERR